jgi:hypothetical protein
MRLRVALPVALASMLLASCGTRPAHDTAAEATNAAESDALLNAVKEHPSMQNEDLAGPPIDVPTTIPPPVAGNMGVHHDGMNMNQATPDDSNVQAPVEANSNSSPTN